MDHETLPPCPHEDCNADSAWAAHHFHSCFCDSYSHRGINPSPSCVTGTKYSTRCYSAHVPNLSESPTGSPGGDEPQPVVPDLVVALRASVKAARERRLAKDDLESLTAERDELRARLDAVLALAALIDRHTERESDPVDFRDADTGMWDEVAARIRRAAEGVE